VNDAWRVHRTTVVARTALGCKVDVQSVIWSVNHAVSDAVLLQCYPRALYDVKDPFDTGKHVEQHMMHHAVLPA
jgi:hypothetical protein